MVRSCHSHAKPRFDAGVAEDDAEAGLRARSSASVQRAGAAMWSSDAARWMRGAAALEEELQAFPGMVLP